MKNISVIGSGTMGNGIAQTFALFNFSVTLYDISSESLDKGEKTILRNLQRMVNKDKITQEEANNTVANIKYTTNFDSILNSELIIEAVSENLELKESIFKELDLKCPNNTILASNTSSISITKLAEKTKRKDKVIGMHFMNPVPIMKLVEIINSKYTSKETTDIITNLSKKVLGSSLYISWLTILTGLPSSLFLMCLNSIPPSFFKIDPVFKPLVSPLNKTISARPSLSKSENLI